MKAASHGRVIGPAPGSPIEHFLEHPQELCEDVTLEVLQPCEPPSLELRQRRSTSSRQLDLCHFLAICTSLLELINTSDGGADGGSSDARQDVPLSPISYPPSSSHRSPPPSLYLISPSSPLLSGDALAKQQHGGRWRGEPTAAAAAGGRA